MRCSLFRPLGEDNTPAALIVLPDFNLPRVCNPCATDKKIKLPSRVAGDYQQKSLSLIPDTTVVLNRQIIFSIII
jgi:hypothetical protein